MRPLTAALVLTIVMAIGNSSNNRGAARAEQPVSAASGVCAPSGSAHTRTTLYFGLSHRGGTVSETEWRKFLRDEVTPRFPDGLTSWEADGQWRKTDGNIARERAKVLLLVHEDGAAIRSSISAIIESYKRMFHQESVLWETAPVCAAF
jgi:Protein of unknown function (DUF3574)